MMLTKYFICNFKLFSTTCAYPAQVCTINPYRNFSKKIKKEKKKPEEVKGLRKSLSPFEVVKQKKADNEYIIGPSLIITPQIISNITEDSNATHNWTNKELELSFHNTFPQTFAIAHRAEKIRNFLTDNEIQRVLVFTDGWKTTKCNKEHGELYIDSAGHIKNLDPESSTPSGLSDSSIVTNPIVYLLRDLITEAAELEGVNVYVFQNIQHYSKYLTLGSKNTKIDHVAVRNKLLNYSSKGVDNYTLFNKLCLTSFMNSLASVDNVHSVFMPMVFQYTPPGEITANSILFNTLRDAFVVNKEEKKVPNIQHAFSMISSNRACKLISDLIRLKCFDKELSEDLTPKEVYFNGFSTTMYDLANALSSSLNTYYYAMSDDTIKDCNKFALEDMLSWPSELHNKDSDSILKQHIIENVNSVKYRTEFRNMIVDHICNNMFVEKA